MQVIQTSFFDPIIDNIISMNANGFIKMKFGDEFRLDPELAQSIMEDITIGTIQGDSHMYLSGTIKSKEIILYLMDKKFGRIHRFMPPHVIFS